MNTNTGRKTEKLNRTIFSLLLPAGPVLGLPAVATPGSGGPGTIVPSGVADQKIGSHSNQLYQVLSSGEDAFDPGNGHSEQAVTTKKENNNG